MSTNGETGTALTLMAKLRFMRLMQEAAHSLDRISDDSARLVLQLLETEDPITVQNVQTTINSIDALQYALDNLSKELKDVSKMKAIDIITLNDRGNIRDI